jgi:uncharacterized Zn-finger protein
MRDPQITGYTPVLTHGVTPEEVIMVDSRQVRCDGGGGALGHPAIFMRIEGEQVTCPYCSRTYRLKDGAGDDHAH